LRIGTGIRSGDRPELEDLTIHSPAFSCLAIETATELPSAALLHAGQITLREAPGLRAPSRSVFEWVLELLGDAGVSLAELHCIAFGAGPGSFTGVRVAVALAQGLGYSRGLPLCPVSTLAALAAGVDHARGADGVACCLDARMGEVYFGIYRGDSEQGVQTVSADALLRPEAVSLPAAGKFLAAGPGWAAYPALTDRLATRFSAVDAARLPSAADVARLARPRFLAGKVVSPAQALPNYLRDRVASVSSGEQSERNSR
jgi:tRNA threonylcarbamoyladenosine biosynthesis protein TsaB